MDWDRCAAAPIACTVTLVVWFFRAIPDVVWAALVAAGVAFFTTRLSNANSRKQLQMQLDADARQKNRAREMALRRDVFLPAIEAVAQCAGALGQLTNLETDPTALARQIVTDLATLSKVQLIASVDTIRPLMEFVNRLMKNSTMGASRHP